MSLLLCSIIGHKFDESSTNSTIAYDAVQIPSGVWHWPENNNNSNHHISFSPTIDSDPTIIVSLGLARIVSPSKV